MDRRNALLVLLALGTSTASVAQTSSSIQKFPDVVAVSVRGTAVDTFDFDVTVSSPYDSAGRYADSIRARSNEGRVFGERKLLHDHASEQPFTRDIYGVKVPPGIKSVLVEARDQKFGYGGKTIEVKLPGR